VARLGLGDAARRRVADVLLEQSPELPADRKSQSAADAARKDLRSFCGLLDAELADKPYLT